jgi:hypothetical protein
MSLKRARMAKRKVFDALMVGLFSITTLPWVADPLWADENSGPQVQPSSLGTLRVPPLTIPNTSVVGLGQSVPKNLVEGRLPDPISLPYGPDREGGWSLTSKEWIAPVYYHQPTYYEDMMLEQHGHERCPPLQPFVSGARFYSGLFFTPYLACLHPPLRDTSSAGKYRPGTIAPGLRQRAPHDTRALGTQLLTTGAGAALIHP